MNSRAHDGFSTARRITALRRLSLPVLVMFACGIALQNASRAQVPPVPSHADAVTSEVLADTDSNHVSLLAPDGSGVSDPSWLTVTDEHDGGATLTLRQLFEVAGQPMSWPQNGLIWPYYELVRRAISGGHDAIISTATDCLFTAPALANSHAFCAFVLTQFNPPDLVDVFTAAFPGLNFLGQHQVALYALDYSKPEFAPVLTDMLNSLITWDEADRRPLLAAAFAMDHYDASLHQAVSRYHTQFQQQIAGYPDYVVFPDFPYSDVGGSAIHNAPQVFAEAIRFGNSMQRLTARGMTEAEQQWQHDYIMALSQVERIDLPRQTRGLRELIGELNRRFRTQQFTAGSDLPDDSDPATDIGGQQLSATDILSTLCNQYGLNVQYGSYPDAWHIGNPWPAHHGISIENACTAHGAFLAVLEARHRSGRGIILRINLHTDRSKIPAFHKTFDWQTVVSGEGTVVALPARLDSRLGTITLPTAPEDLDSFPAFSVQGTATVPAPAIVHQLEQVIVPGLTDFRMAHDAFQLHYRDNADAIDITWGSARLCCPANFRLPTQDDGIVTVYDAGGHIISRGYATPLRSDDTTEPDSRLYLPKRISTFRQPARLEWTITPLLQRYTFALAFNNVRLLRSQPPAGNNQ